jgi:hypothetical protein
MSVNNKKKSRRQRQKGADASTAVIKTISRKPGKLSKLKDPVENYGYRQTFVPPEYDLAQISLIEDGESYVKQAFTKKTTLMFKEGEVFSGKNKETINYIKARIRQMEFVTSTPWRALLKTTGKELIAKSNYFWVKVRNNAASGGASGVNKKNPIAGYFGMAAETVRVKKNKSGRIIKYRQQMPNGRWKEFSPEDIIHFRADVKPGFTFGTPRIVPVIPDIQALRRLEENVEILFYQTLFPIFQYTVGTEAKPAGKITLGDGSTIDEVEYIRQQIAYMPTEGGIVTPERHKLEYIGSKGATPGYDNVLSYFKARVLTGLGISSIDIGDGDSSNRATADSLSKALIDSVKDYQDVMEQHINSQVIAELLMEGDFAYDVLVDENIVSMNFIEIDLEEQMKKNVNAQLLYAGDVIDVDEARHVTGRQPITEEQEEAMYTERVTMKVMEGEAENAVELTKVAAAIAPKPAATGSGSATTKTKKKATSAKKSTKSQSSPTNQHGTKTGPQKSRLDRWIKNETRILKKLQEFMEVDSDDYGSCVLASKLRLTKRAKGLEMDERNSFIETVEKELANA